MSNLPTDRVITIHEGMKKMDIENSYLEAFMDYDKSITLSAEDKYKNIEKRAELKAQLLKAQSEEEKEKIQKQLTELS